METIKECPVCDSSLFSSLFQAKDNVVSHETFNIEECNSCRFKFTNPRPTESEIGRYYESDNYIYHSNKNRGLFLKVFHFIRDLAIRRKLKLILSLTKQPGSIMDYGAGTGEFLNAARKSGWTVTGLEVSPVARQFAKSNFNLDFLDKEDLVNLPSSNYDIITLWHVLEHVHQLDNTLTQLNRVLKTSGYLLIAVPNNASRDAQIYGKHWAAYDVPRHLWHFTPRDMERLMKKYNFKIENMLSLPFDAFYVSMLSEKYKNGSTGYIKGGFNGLLSNLNQGADHSRCSSVLYVISKK